MLRLVDSKADFADAAEVNRAERVQAKQNLAGNTGTNPGSGAGLPPLGISDLSKNSWRNFSRMIGDLQNKICEGSPVVDLQLPWHGFHKRIKDASFNIFRKKYFPAVSDPLKAASTLLNVFDLRPMQFGQAGKVDYRGELFSMATENSERNS